MIAMDEKTKNHQLVFEFLLAKFHSHEAFTQQQCYGAVPNLTAGSMRTYWSKWIKHFLMKTENGEFRVTEAFRPYATWDSFRKHVSTQVRRTFSDYTALTYDNLIVYDFLMPLSNEGHLRTALDALFYKDTVLARLKTIPHGDLTKRFSIDPGESHEVYLDRVCDWTADQFGGYSISHVSGRFRAAPLATMADVANYQKLSGRYLIDETTAVVRFIFPCGTPRRQKTPISSSKFDEDDYEYPEQEPADAATIRWFFRVLFVQSILQVVNGEDEIWMVESGIRNRLHIWRMEDG